MRTTFFHNQVITITYESEWELGTAVMNGFPSSHDFREAITMCIRLIEENKPLRWLADNRKMKVIRQVDQDWFIENALPYLLASTIRRNATIVSEDIFNKMAVEQIVKRAGNLGSMLLQEFNDPKEALDWVKQPITAASQ